MNYRIVYVIGLVELYDLLHVLPHMERGSAWLAIYVHLQGYVRYRDTAQPAAIGRRRIPHLRHLPRVHTRVRIPLLLSSDVNLIRWHRLCHVLRPQHHHQQHLYVADLEPWQRYHVQSVLDGMVRPIQLSTSFQLLPGPVHTAKLDLSSVIWRVDRSRWRWDLFMEQYIPCCPLSEKLFMNTVLCAREFA